VSPEPAEPASERLGRVLALLPEVTLGILFGSRARGRARADSDFDIGILLDAETAAAERGATIRALAGRLGREVSSAHLDIVILNDAPALLRHRVLRDGIVLFQRSAQARVRFATRTIRDYQDGFHRRREFTRRRIERVRGSATSDGGPGDLLEKARVAARLLAEAEGLP
jgi:hypothetical protein